MRSRESGFSLFLRIRNGCPFTEAAKRWYNVTTMKQYITGEYYTPIQLKMPLEIERIIEITDPVYTFHEVISHIDLNKYLAEEERRTGRPKYDCIKLMKVILFAFMEHGYISAREIHKLCKTDIRFLWLLDDTPAPSHMTIASFIRKHMNGIIRQLFKEINQYIFEKETVDINHLYIDGTKITANANRYSWVWKKSCLRNRDKTFVKITEILEEMNVALATQGVKLGIRDEYAIEYVEELLEKYVSLVAIDPGRITRGRGHRKTIELRLYDRLKECLNRLKKYAKQIEICGDERNSYSKTDKGASFMRVKRDYMGNDQLLPAYNLQLGICDEYIAVYDVKQYASDMECFQPLIERYYSQYSRYPEYPVADAGYGSYNNYLYCEEHGMKKYMKFPTYERETKNAAYREDPYRAVNFAIDDDGDMVCPNGKKFRFLRRCAVRGNRYGREEELYQCEDCTGCPCREKCCKGEGNRTVRINVELTRFHEEVLGNLNCIHGALLRMNRSIQAEGSFGSIKWNRSYTRARRRGIEGLLLEIGLISCGFNLHKYHLRKRKALKAA